MSSRGCNPAHGLWSESLGRVRVMGPEKHPCQLPSLVVTPLRMPTDHSVDGQRQRVVRSRRTGRSEHASAGERSCWTVFGGRKEEAKQVKDPTSCHRAKDHRA